MLFQNKLITTSNSEKFSCLQLLETMLLLCKTSEKEKFHDIALIISREIYGFVRCGFFRGSRKKFSCLQLLETMPVLFFYFEDRKCHTKLFLDHVYFIIMLFETLLYIL